MANGYQAQHSRPRTGHPGRRAVLGGVTALIVIVAGWVAANQGSDHTNTAQSDRSSQRVFASNGTTTTSDSTTSLPPADTTSTAETSTSAISFTPGSPAVAAGNHNFRTARQPSTPAQPTRTTGTTPATRVTVPALPLAVFIPPTATKGNTTCVNTTGEWVITYTVTFSGGKNWTIPGGGSTGTEVQKFPGPASAPAHAVLTTAHVFDTADNQTRIVPLSNPGLACGS